MSEPRQTRWSRDKKESGLCVSCGKAAFGKSLCPDHLAAQRARMRDRRLTGKDLHSLVKRAA